MNIPIELKTRIYDHIGTVQSHLGDLPPDEQREILQSLETHIYDALESRSSGEPSMELLETIIAELDPPESYGSATPIIAESDGASLSSGRKIVFLSAVGILSILFIAIWLADPFSSQWMTNAPPPEPSAPAPTQPEEIKAPSRQIIPRRRAFISPQSVVGKWTALDFVSNISDFHPKTLKWKGELEIKELQFREDGTTNKDWWTWKDDELLHSGDKSAAGFMIARIDQKDYLFLEWISGDALRDGQKPKYYVFRRGGLIDPSIPKVIQEGFGWGSLRIGASREELIAELGEPHSPHSSLMTWSDLGLRCDVSSRGADIITFLNPFDGATTKSIKIGSTEEELLEAYGNPEQISYGSLRSTKGEAKSSVHMRWPKQGINVALTAESGVYLIEIHKPMSLEAN